MESAFLFDIDTEPSRGDSVPEAKAMPLRQKRTIQDLRLGDGVLAVKESVSCGDLDELRSRLIARFDQNSQETRLRYARFVIANFFRDGLDGVARKTWMAYQEEKILTDVLRYLYLQNEPVMGACVAECLFPLEIGMRIPAAVFERFLHGFFDGEPTAKTSKRLKMNLKVLGILERCRGEDDRLVSPGPSKISLLILLHWIFDGQECPSYEDAPWASPEVLAAFLARHVTPYDPDTDDYDRPPFASDIKEGKNDPIYNAHSYHTKVPPRSIIPYILHYTKPDDVILDPFCGSGMTGVAAQMCADPPADILAQFPDLKDRVGPRACVLNDLSPAACHIAYNYNTPVDVDALRAEFERIKAAVKDEFDWLYGTEHYEPAVGLYDPKNPEVASRLKNPSDAGLKGQNVLFEDEERTWELLDKADVEERLGYPVTELPRDDAWGDLDVSTVERWICIPATIQYTIWSDVYRCEGFVTIEEPTGRSARGGRMRGNRWCGSGAWHEGVAMRLCFGTLLSTRRGK